MIGIIGAGNLGKAVINQLAKNVKVSDIKEGSYKGIKIINDNKRLAQDCDIIILTVKPQHMLEVLDDIKDYNNLIITFAAGLKIQSYESKLNARIIRVMTNLAVKNSKGISVYKLGSSCSQDDKETAENILKHLGKYIEVKDEALLDVVTGISGSGIAYFIKIMEIFVKTAESQNLDKETAKKIIHETVKGALSLTKNDNYQEIIEQIASKGGTTEQGLKELEEKELEAILKSVVIKTVDKCKAISEND